MEKLKITQKYGTFCIMDQQLNVYSKLNTFVVGEMKMKKVCIEPKVRNIKPEAK